jgi:RNA-binding protein YlmH
LNKFALILSAANGLCYTRYERKSGNGRAAPAAERRKSWIAVRPAENKRAARPAENKRAVRPAENERAVRPAENERAAAGRTALPREEEQIRARAEDLMRRCREQYRLTASGFLDLHQQSAVRAWLREDSGPEGRLAGGYEEAERRLLLCVPDYLAAPEAHPEEEAIAVLRVHWRQRPAPTHRDLLGALLGLGIRRETVGDILVREDGADILVLREMAEFLAVHFCRAGRAELTVGIVPLSELRVPPARTREIRDTVASPRLDTVTAAAFGLSRARAAAAVRRGIVFVNGEQVMKADRQLEEGDRLVLRGSGKAVLTRIGGRSRKGRLYICLQRYL